MNINFQFGKSPEEFCTVQWIADPLFRAQTPPLDTRELLRQIKKNQPHAFRDVHYEIVTPDGPALDLSQVETK